MMSAWNGRKDPGGAMALSRTVRRRLERLAKGYTEEEAAPCLDEIERKLWRTTSFWPWSRKAAPAASSDVESWIVSNLGWSLPCAEVLSLIARCRDEPASRVIDVGAGSGLWTRLLKRAFGAVHVIGLDPEPKGEGVIATTFDVWRRETGGLQDGDIVLLSWPPCQGQAGQELGTEVLNAIGSKQMLVYIGAGPWGPAGTREFHEHLSHQFEEYATEPLPRICRMMFPRDYARVYRRKVQVST